MSVHSKLLAVLLSMPVSLAGAQDGPKSPSIEQKPTPANIYQVCIAIETPEISAHLKAKNQEGDTKAVAHMICTAFANVCKENPEGKTCQDRLDKYKAEIARKRENSPELPAR
jgi:hypothetical protein